MDTKTYLELIDRQYEEIVKKLDGSTLYGHLIDITEKKELVVAAYEMAILEQLRATLDRL